MQPRLKTSKKWTALPKELMQQVQSVFKETFGDRLGDGKLEAQGRIYPEEILFYVGYRPKGALKQQGFEVSVAYKKDKDNVLKLLHLTVDAAGSLLEQILSAEDDADFPRLWTEVDFEGRKIHVQYSTTNTELEAEADKLLGLGAPDDGELARGDWDEDADPDQVKASLGIDPDEDLDEEQDEEDGPGPKGRA